MAPLVTHRWNGFCLCAVVLTAIAPVGIASAADSGLSADLATYFQPDRTMQVLLSPDGRYLAYTVREDRTLRLVIENLDEPEQRIAAFVETEGKRSFFNRTVTVPATLPFVQWADARRIVYLVSHAGGERGYEEEVRIVDADGRNARTLLTSNDVETELSAPPRAGGSDDAMAPPSMPVPRRMQVIGLLGGVPATLAVAALGNSRVETTVFQIELASGKHTTGEEFSGVGRVLFDHAANPRVRETPRIAAPPPEALRLRPPPGMSGMPMGGHEGPRLQPQEFLYAEAGHSRWKSLDGVVRETPPLGFHYSDRDFYGARSIPLGFAEDPHVLYFGSNVGRDTFGVYALDLRTGRRTRFAVERAGFDVADTAAVFAEQTLVLDRDFRLAGVRLAGGTRGTEWIDARLADWQQRLDALMAHRNVTILGWSDDRSRVLALAAGPTEPGRYFVCTQGTPVQLVEVLRRTKIDAGLVARAEPLEIPGADGAPLTGVITFPTHPLVNPPPLVLLCGDFAGRPVGFNFDRGTQALAGLGFLVVEINARGGGGLGARHRDAIKDGFDRAALEDLRTTFDWLGAHVPYDRKRVAIVGDGFGGYVALHAAQLYPAVFRCAVAVNGPADPERWLSAAAWAPPGASALIPPAFAARRSDYFAAQGGKFAAPSLLTNAASFTQPLLILQSSSAAKALRGPDLRDALARAGREGEYRVIDAATDPDAAEARAGVYRQIAGFLNTHLYHFRVDVGHEREVP